MTKKVPKKILIERHFFVNLRKNLFLAAHAAAADFFGPAARRRRPKLTGAPPPTQLRRRTALGPDSSLHHPLQLKSSPLVIQTHFKFADVSYSRSVNFLLHKAYRCYSRLGSDPVNSKTTVLEKQSQACTFRSRKATVSHARCASTPSC